MKNGDVKITGRTWMPKGNYLGKFVHWCTSYEDEIDDYQYCLWFQIIDERNEYGKDIFVVHETFGNSQKDKIHDGVYPEFAQSLRELSPLCRNEEKIESLLDKALGGIYSLKISHEPKLGYFWDGVSRIEAAPQLLLVTKNQQ